MQNPKEKSKENKPTPVSRHSFLVTATKQCLQIDKNRINFCKYPIFASSYKQIIMNVQLLDYFAEHQKKQFHLLKIKTQAAIKSHGNVFTFKVVDGGQQVTQIQIPIKQAEPLQVNIRATIPQLQVSTDINGTLTIQVDDLMPLTIPITSRGQVPSIICLKEMINKKTGFKMIKIPSKTIMKIPFKNSSNINFFFELKLVSKQENSDADGVKLRVSLPKFEEEKKKQNPIIKVDANSTFCIQLEFQLLKKDGSIRIARRLLILQVQGTNLFFPFPLQVIISQ